MNPYDQAQVEDYDGADRWREQQRAERLANRKPYRPTVTDPQDFLMGGDDDEKDDTPPWVTAKYDGQCSNRGCEIIAGVTMIRADGYDEWECCE